MKLARRTQILKGFAGHSALFIINFFVLVGVVESFQLLGTDLPLINMIILDYMLVHTSIMLSVQLGVQILELIRIRMPTFLVSYYFQLEDNEIIPVPLLDPTRSNLALIILLLVISGGPVFYPIFAIYGFLLTYAHIVTIVLNPSVIVAYFELFLNWTPPLMLLIVGIVVISIVIIEFRHL
ncbi:MAG: hypothetical protein K9W43_04170 [Candidatus Thorarchaeota archaeon]|nr:hypothetical protein [Candidatus Thorarchaeota archaeon]